LNNQTEDDLNSAGTLISSLVTGFTDADAGALKGIALQNVDNTNGTWQYTLNGTTWLAVGAPTSANTLLLAADATTAIRFVPNANYAGPSGYLYYWAWRQWRHC
jgi:hypothetical protein